jgi:hypothetical protein
MTALAASRRLLASFLPAWRRVPPDRLCNELAVNAADVDWTDADLLEATEEEKSVFGAAEPVDCPNSLPDDSEVELTNSASDEQDKALESIDAPLVYGDDKEITPELHVALPEPDQIDDSSHENLDIGVRRNDEDATPDADPGDPSSNQSRTWLEADEESEEIAPNDFSDLDLDDLSDADYESDKFRIDDAKLESFEVEAGVDDFEEDAYQDPWLSPVEEGNDAALTRLARSKASKIASLLVVGRADKFDNTLNFLEEFFLDYPHSSTFGAINDAAEQDLDMPMLRSMLELREAVADQPEFLVCRYGYHHGIIRLRQPTISWRLARLVCTVQFHLPPDLMIEEKWLDEWFLLRPGDLGFKSFPKYVELRIQQQDDRLLDDGLTILKQDDEG